MSAPSSDLRDLACPSATDCVAVGDFANLSGGHQLAEGWNGTAWSDISPPVANGYRDDFFEGIACPTATSCVAVGYGRGPIRTATWNGTAWTPHSPDDGPAGAVANLFSVSCIAEASCFAVGSSYTYPVFAPVIERWDGQQWSIVPSPGVTGDNSSLSRISCVSATFCLAVGYISGDVTPTRPLTEQWDGATWSVVDLPTPSGTTNASVSDVSCSSEFSCFAVGAYDTANLSAPLIESWDGDAWTVVAGRPVAGSGVRYSSLGRVSCSSAQACIAVGSINTYDPHPSRSLAERWDGTSWSITRIDKTLTDFTAVTCISAASCFAIADRGTTAQVLEHWDGSVWSAVAKPPLDPAPSNATLVGVSCAISTACFAVGSSTNSAHRTVTTPLIERPSAGGWTAVAGPVHSGATFTQLWGVSCVGATSCYAVGEWRAYGASQTLVEHWDGRRWSFLPSPNIRRSTRPATANRLLSVSCTSDTNCFAVGTATDNNATLTLITTLVEHWDGKAWTIVPSPNRANSGENRLESVSCATASSCVAVGRSVKFAFGSPSDYRTLAERWNGSAWSVVPTPNAASGVGDLASVSCAGASSCVAVGSAYRFALSKSLVESWNGSVWTRLANADPASATHSSLSGVSCVAPGSCYAVGSDYAKSKQNNEVLVTALAGGHWSIVPGASPAGTRNTYLNGVSCSGAGICSAVGGYDTDGSPRTLVEQSS